MIPLSAQIAIAALLTAAALWQSIRRDLEVAREQRASADVVARVREWTGE